jgi:hypothetical protein
MYLQECGVLEVKLHVALYFQRLKIHILKFQKNLKKILELAIDICYKWGKLL